MIVLKPKVINTPAPSTFMTDAIKKKPWIQIEKERLAELRAKNTPKPTINAKEIVLKVDNA